MRKTVLMLILCAPLFWTAWQEGRRLYQVSAWSRTQPPKTDDPQHAKAAADLKRIKKEVDAIVDLPEDVAATIVRLAPKPADFGKGSLEKALLDHVTKRDKARQKIEQARLNAVKIENDIRDALEGLRANDRPRASAIETSRNLTRSSMSTRDRTSASTTPSCAPRPRPSRPGPSSKRTIRAASSTSFTRTSTGGRRTRRN